MDEEAHVPAAAVGRGLLLRSDRVSMSRRRPRPSKSVLGEEEERHEEEQGDGGRFFRDDDPSRLLWREAGRVAGEAVIDPSRHLLGLNKDAVSAARGAADGTGRLFSAFRERRREVEAMKERRTRVQREEGHRNNAERLRAMLLRAERATLSAAAAVSQPHSQYILQQQQHQDQQQDAYGGGELALLQLGRGAGLAVTPLVGAVDFTYHASEQGSRSSGSSGGSSSSGGISEWEDCDSEDGNDDFDFEAAITAYQLDGVLEGGSSSESCRSPPSSDSSSGSRDRRRRTTAALKKQDDAAEKGVQTSLDPTVGGEEGELLRELQALRHQLKASQQQQKHQQEEAARRQAFQRSVSGREERERRMHEDHEQWWLGWQEERQQRQQQESHDFEMFLLDQQKLRVARKNKQEEPHPPDCETDEARWDSSSAEHELSSARDLLDRIERELQQQLMAVERVPTPPPADAAAATVSRAPPLVLADRDKGVPTKLACVDMGQASKMVRIKEVAAARRRGHRGGFGSSSSSSPRPAAAPAVDGTGRSTPRGRSGSGSLVQSLQGSPHHTLHPPWRGS